MESWRKDVIWGIGRGYATACRKSNIVELRTASWEDFDTSQGTKSVGSLLLGLYDDKGLLNHVGFTSAFTDSERMKGSQIVRPVIGGSGFTGRTPGGPSRWSKRTSDEWIR